MLRTLFKQTQEALSIPGHSTLLASLLGKLTHKITLQFYGALRAPKTLFFLKKRASQLLVKNATKTQQPTTPQARLDMSVTLKYQNMSSWQIVEIAFSGPLSKGLRIISLWLWCSQVSWKLKSCIWGHPSSGCCSMGGFFVFFWFFLFCSLTGWAGWLVCLFLGFVFHSAPWQAMLAGTRLGWLADLFVSCFCFSVWLPDRLGWL